MITVSSLKILNSLPLSEDNEEAYVTDEQKIYSRQDGQWVPKALPQGKMNISVYDMNKQLISQLGVIDDKAALNLVRKYKNETEGKYYMLVCRDLNYYTLFAIGESEDHLRIEREVVDCLHDLGEIKSVEKIEETNAIEVWVQSEGEEPLVAYFFNYDKGVIVCQ